ncbi:MAG TPA: transglycosylase domain-containing protein, partial [Candidatus Woesebacteria bacterium]|nr:transglycosylase domain-containing protein [Candidatus Woesebacteria bacterium]
MVTRFKTTIGKIWKKLTLSAIFALFFVVNCLIFIGEWTQKIVLSPFVYAYKLGRLIILSFISALTIPPEEEILPDQSIIVKKTIITTESFTPFKKEILFKSFRKKKIKKITTGFIKSIFSVISLVLKKIGKFSWSFLVLIYYAIIRSPLYFFYFVNELCYFMYSIFKSIIQFIINCYKYLIGPYFRSFLYGVAFCLLVVVGYHGYQFVQNLPSPTSIGVLNYAQSTHLYDRNGKLLYEIYRDVSRTPIKIEELPHYVVPATIAIEDKHFYSHKGVSFFGGILRAVKDTYKTKELQGGSTITQQLVKSALLSPERTVERKLKEITLAVWTEQMYTKDQIMEMYLNQVPYGGAAYGIEEASNIYFGKSAKYLTLNEAALLAGLPQAPSLYSPFVNPQAAETRRNMVLTNMYELGYITKKERDIGLIAKVEIQPPKTNINAPHFVFYTRNAMVEQYGSKAVEEGGFKVMTSLDLEIQQKAEEILSEELEKVKDLNVTNGGIIVLDPRTGEILAMVGSNNYFNEIDGAFNVTTALRQPGSTLKPMLYAMALEKGF